MNKILKDKNKKKKLLFITGTRAEYGLAKATIFKLAQSPKINFRLLATGMHTLKKYGLTLNEIKKDTAVHCVVPIQEKDDMLSALSKEIMGIKQYAQKEKIDAIIVIGDRDETFAGATVGIHLNIPVVHVSGGDVSGPSVDHYLRNAMTIFSKLHLVQTKQAAQNVIRLGADPAHVHIVGSLGLHDLDPLQLTNRQETARQLKLNPGKPWYIVAHHPTPFETTNFKNQIDSALKALTKIDPVSEKIIFYPNSDEGSSVFISSIEKLRNKKNYHIFKNLEHELFLAALYHSQAMIGNSSAGLFEAGYLKKPFILVGNRQAGRERGVNVIGASYNSTAIAKAVHASASKPFQIKLDNTPSIYQGGDVAGRVARTVFEYLKV